jgi:hypothetical protein
MLSCGFLNINDVNLTRQAKDHYNSAEHSIMKANGKIPNVIKAYYVAYIPDPAYIHPSYEGKDSSRYIDVYVFVYIHLHMYIYI